MIDNSSTTTDSTITNPSINATITNTTSDNHSVHQDQSTDPLDSIPDHDILPLIPAIDDPHGASLYAL